MKAPRASDLTTSWFCMGGGSGDGHKYLGVSPRISTILTHSSLSLSFTNFNSIPSSTFFTYTPSYFKQTKQSIHNEGLNCRTLPPQRRRLWPGSPSRCTELSSLPRRHGECQARLPQLCLRRGRNRRGLQERPNTVVIRSSGTPAADLHLRLLQPGGLDGDPAREDLQSRREQDHGQGHVRD